MRRLTIQEVRKIQLEILDVVAKFCDENNINYWLNGGTLLGAIRHKGYIPWDDDIDLGMLRPDYDKFMKLFNEHNTRYKFFCIENKPDFHTLAAQIIDMNNNIVLYFRAVKIGIGVDLFVFDNAPDDDKIAEEMFKRRGNLKKWHNRRVLPLFKCKPVGNIFRRICAYTLRIFLRILPRDYFSKKLIATIKRFSNENTKRVGDFTGLHDAVYDREILENLTTAEFEGKFYKVPVRYDEFLRGLYGDYMQLPPEEERVPSHPYDIYELDDE